MKTMNSFILLLATLLMFSACERNEIEMRTKINSDGTCVRTLFFKTDSAGLVGGLNKVGGAVALSDEWDVSWSSEKSGGWHPYPMSVEDYDSLRANIKNFPDTVILRAEREFASVENMSGAFPLQINGKRLNAGAKLEKNFQWFYTIYKYSETIGGMQDSIEIPLSDYVDDEHALFWFTGYPELLQGRSIATSRDWLNSIQTSIDKWQNANYFNYLYNMIAEYYAVIENPPVDKSTFLSLRDSVMQYALSHDFNITMHNTDALFRDFFKSDAYSFLFVQDSEYMNYLSEQVKWYLDLMTLRIDYAIELPGSVTDVGKGLYHDSTFSVYYNLSGEHFVPRDYEITAESRVVNIWAFVLTAVLGIILIVFLLRLKR